MSWTDLPEEIQEHISKFIGTKDLVALAGTCSTNSILFREKQEYEQLKHDYRKAKRYALLSLLLYSTSTITLNGKEGTQLEIQCSSPFKGQKGIAKKLLKIVQQKPPYKISGKFIVAEEYSIYKYKLNSVGDLIGLLSMYLPEGNEEIKLTGRYYGNENTYYEFVYEDIIFLDELNELPDI